MEEMMINEAREKIRNNELNSSQILDSFNIIGVEYLNGEGGYYNTSEGINGILFDYNISKKGLVTLMRRSYNKGYYNPKDKYVSFDGYEIVSFNSIEYFTNLLIQKMNNECAEYIMGL